MPKRIARWNPARDVWETETTGLFCEHSDVFSETWPTSGMTRGGVAFELPTSEHRTDDSGCSLLLPTPMTEPDTGNGHARNLGREASLLPTPRTSDTNGAGQHGTGGPDLRTAVELLPTPRAQLGQDVNNKPYHRTYQGREMKQNLENAVALVIDPCKLYLRHSGAPTSPRFAAGNTSSDDPHPHPPNPDHEADSGSRPS